MCLGNPDICRCSACFHAKLQPKEYAYKYPILTPGPFYYSLKKIEEEGEKESIRLPDLTPQKTDYSMAMDVMKDMETTQMLSRLKSEKARHKKSDACEESYDDRDTKEMIRHFKNLGLIKDDED